MFFIVLDYGYRRCSGVSHILTEKISGQLEESSDRIFFYYTKMRYF